MKVPSLKTSKNHLKLKGQLAIEHSMTAFVLLLKLHSRENHNIYEHLSKKQHYTTLKPLQGLYCSAETQLLSHLYT